jgi:hypothetical protein
VTRNRRRSPEQTTVARTDDGRQNRRRSPEQTTVARTDDGRQNRRRSPEQTTVARTDDGRQNRRRSPEQTTVARTDDGRQNRRRSPDDDGRQNHSNGQPANTTTTVARFRSTIAIEQTTVEPEPRYSPLPNRIGPRPPREAPPEIESDTDTGRY